MSKRRAVGRLRAARNSTSITFLPVDKNEIAPVNTTDNWFREYHVQFLEKLYSNCKLSAIGNTRRDFLSAYYKFERLLRAVVKIRIALPAKQKQKFISDLKKLSYRLSNGESTGEKVLKSKETT